MNCCQLTRVEKVLNKTNRTINIQTSKTRTIMVSVKSFRNECGVQARNGFDAFKLL